MWKGAGHPASALALRPEPAWLLVLLPTLWCLMTLACLGECHAATLIPDVLWNLTTGCFYSLVGVRVAPRTIGILAAALPSGLPVFADLGVDGSGRTATASLLVLVQFVSRLAKALLLKLDRDHTV